LISGLKQHHQEKPQPNPFTTARPSEDKKPGAKPPLAVVKERNINKVTKDSWEYARIATFEAPKGRQQHSNRIRDDWVS